MERLSQNVSKSLGRISTNLEPLVSLPPLLLSFLPKTEFSKGNKLKRCFIVWHLKELLHNNHRVTAHHCHPNHSLGCSCLFQEREKSHDRKTEVMLLSSLNKSFPTIAVVVMKGNHSSGRY